MVHRLISKARQNFKKSGGFSGMGKKFSEVGSKFVKAGDSVMKVGGFFDPRIAEVGDAIKTAGQVSQVIGQGVSAGAGGDAQGVGQALAQVPDMVRRGSQLRFM